MNTVINETQPYLLTDVQRQDYIESRTVPVVSPQLARLEDVLLQMQTWDKFKLDVNSSLDGISFDPQTADILIDGHVDIFQQPIPVLQTGHALAQVCERLKINGVPTAKELKGYPPHLRATVLNYFLNEVREKSSKNDWMVRLFQPDAAPPAARAVLTSRYKSVLNSDLMEIMVNLLREGEQQIPEWNVKHVVSSFTPDRMSMRVIVTEREVEGDGLWGIGFHVWHEELGGSSIRVKPLVLRNACSNSNTLKSEQYRYTHTKYTPAALKTFFTEAIGECINMSDSILDQAVEKQAQQVPSLADRFLKISKRYKFSDTAQVVGMSNFAGKTDGNELDIVNAITWAAHQSGQNETERERMEDIAGALLMA